MQAILFTPADISPEQEVQLQAVLATQLVAAVILRRQHNEIEEAYAKRIKHLIAPCQDSGAAVLLDAMPDLVKKLKADGVHMISGQRQFQEALENLKPDFIVGAGDVRSDHEAMLRGEAGADYVMFGDPDRAPSVDDLEIASWWSQTVQVDGAVCTDPSSLEQTIETGVHFLAFGDLFWQLPNPEISLIQIAAQLPEPVSE